MNKIKIGMMVLSLPPEKSTVVPQAVKASGLMGDCLEKSLNNAGFICVREKSSSG